MGANKLPKRLESMSEGPTRFRNISSTRQLSSRLRRVCRWPDMRCSKRQDGRQGNDGARQSAMGTLEKSFGLWQSMG
jgi:hypothetical protein